MDDVTAFYSRHSGGSGAVIVVQAFQQGSVDPRMGIFGSLETAHAWMRGLGDEYTSVVSPYIVDDPDWGNESQ